jgi:hypothetical protein
MNPAGRDIKGEALQQVAGSSYSKRQEAQQFGTELAHEAFTLQSKLMRDVTRDFMRSEACANSQEAFMQYVLGSIKSGGWFCEEALWMAMYGATFCVEAVVVDEVPAAAGAGAAAAAA